MILKNPPKLTNKNGIIDYIEISLWGWLKQLYKGLFSLNFNENFESFTVSDLIIPANTEVTITNAFKMSNPGFIPSARIIVRQIGDANIIDGSTKWTSSHVYLFNPSANDAKITVIFFL